ncbi:MAG TPA: vWA domain-containing protein [Thermomicrobiales bacterium]|nr:vWA domain-containing protein [Thermomicrobiales bacterium]
MDAGLLAPLGLLAGLSLAVIVLLHMRRQVPATRRVSSLRFWTPASRDDLERSRLRKPPFSWMLLLQLLAAAAITIALARPFTDGVLGAFASRTDPRHDIVILDGSTSMQAVTGLNATRTRFDDARATVIGLLDEWQPGDITTLLVVGTSTRTFSAANQQQADDLRARLRTMTVPGGRADINAALRLAGNLTLPDRDNRITLVTDGAIAVDPAIVGAIRAPVTLDLVGGNGDTTNDAITAISSRADTSGSGNVLVAFTVSHFADAAATVPYTVTSDGKEIVTDVVTLGPNESRQITVSVPGDTPAISVAISQRDILQADNAATLHLERDALSQLAIMLVADNPGSLQRALAVIPGVRVDVYPGNTPGLAALSAGYDLAVFQGVSPTPGDLPAIPMLFFQPQPLDGTFGIQGALTAPTIDTIDAGSPVLADVDLAGVTFASVPAYALTPGANAADTPQVLVSGVGGSNAATAGTPVAASAGGGPLLWQGRLNDQPYIAAAFTPDGSNIAQRVAFPILVANAVSSLTVDQIPAALSLGDPLTYRPSAGATSIAIDPPLGVTETLAIPAATGNAPDDATARQVTFLDTSQTGTYRVRELASDGTTLREGAFVVNAGQIQESNLRPNPDLASALAASSPQGTSAGVASGKTEIWSLVAAVALALIVLEWIVALRRAGRRPKPAAETAAPGRPARAVL